MANGGLTKKEFLSENNNVVYKNYTGITIRNEAIGVIQGRLKNNFTFNLEAKWADLFSSLIPGAEFLMKTGDASLTTGVFSKKYYQGGNNLNLSTEFRIFDEGQSDINLVTNTATKLSSMTTSNAFSSKQSAQQAFERLGSSVESSLDVVKKFIKGDTSDIPTDVVNILEKFTETDRKVTVIIGNFFRCRGMVITNVGVTYSQELTNTGPLYGDFTVSFMSLESMVRSGNGVYDINNVLANKRYKITKDGEDYNLSVPLDIFNI